MTISSGSVENGGCLGAAKLEEIIARLEAAVGPDRELDARIFCAIHHPDKNPQRNFFYKNREEWGVFVTNQPEPGITFHDAPHYTSSLDDALTLAPDGYLVGLVSIRTEFGDQFTWWVWRPEIADKNRTGPRRDRIRTLCIAACKARLAEHLSTRGNARPITPPQASQEQGEE